MPLFENFPYTDYHNLNLDWILDKIKKLEDDVGLIDVSGINTLTNTVSKHDTEIQTNSNNISANKADIVNNKNNIETNKENIDSKQNQIYYYSTSGTKTKIAENVFGNLESRQTGYLVSQSGVYDALQKKQNTLTFDSTPTENSTNPVTSGGVYTAIQTIDVGNVTNIAKQVDTNTANIATNTSDIANLKSSVETNTNNITANTENIATNAGKITTNTGNITKNTNDIASLKTRLDSAETNINSNTTNISGINTSLAATSGTPTFADGITVTRSQLKKQLGTVSFTCNVTGTFSTGTVLLCTIPEGFRPSVLTEGIACDNGGNFAGRVIIRTNGSTEVTVPSAKTSIAVTFSYII